MNMAERFLLAKGNQLPLSGLIETDNPLNFFEPVSENSAVKEIRAIYPARRVGKSFNKDTMNKPRKSYLARAFEDVEDIWKNYMILESYRNGYVDDIHKTIENIIEKALTANNIPQGDQNLRLIRRIGFPYPVELKYHTDPIVEFFTPVIRRVKNPITQNFEVSYWVPHVILKVQDYD